MLSPAKASEFEKKGLYGMVVGVIYIELARRTLLWIMSHQPIGEYDCGEYW